MVSHYWSSPRFRCWLLTIPGFSMPTLNSIFPFLEAVCPKSDLCWHIRRARLLRHYKSVWAVFRDDKTQPQSITFDCEQQFATKEAMEDSRFMLCLVPDSWSVLLEMQPNSAWLCKLREFCLHLVSVKTPGAILERGGFFLEAESWEAESWETGNDKSWIVNTFIRDIEETESSGLFIGCVLTYVLYHFDDKGHHVMFNHNIRLTHLDESAKLWKVLHSLTNLTWRWSQRENQ